MSSTTTNDSPARTAMKRVHRQAATPTLACSSAPPPRVEPFSEQSQRKRVRREHAPTTAVPESLQLTLQRVQRPNTLEGCSIFQIALPLSHPDTPLKQHLKTNCDGVWVQLNIQYDVTVRYLLDDNSLMKNRAWLPWECGASDQNSVDWKESTRLVGTAAAMSNGGQPSTPRLFHLGLWHVTTRNKKGKQVPLTKDEQILSSRLGTRALGQWIYQYVLGNVGHFSSTCRETMSMTSQREQLAAAYMIVEPCPLKLDDLEDAVDDESNDVELQWVKHAPMVEIREHLYRHFRTEYASLLQFFSNDFYSSQEYKTLSMTPPPSPCASLSSSSSSAPSLSPSSSCTTGNPTDPVESLRQRITRTSLSECIRTSRLVDTVYTKLGFQLIGETVSVAPTMYVRMDRLYHEICKLLFNIHVFA